MRLLTAIVVVAVIGVGLGVGAAMLDSWRWPYGDVELAGKRIVEPGETAAATGPQPKVSVEKETYDFDVMDASAEGSHDFIFANEGEAPLALHAGETSCSCTLAYVEAKEIPPGGKARVTIKWDAKGRDGPFRQTATIETNDPSRAHVVLTVEGTITQAVAVVPSEVVFSRVMAGEEATAEARVYCHLPQEWDIVGYNFSNPDTADHFDATYEPLGPDDLKEDENARSGYLVRVTVKSGLPLGAFRQTIQLETNLEGVPTVEVPINGSIRSEISIVGPGWHDEISLLSMGTVAGRQGVEKRLLILVGGPQRKEVKFTPAGTVPDWLEVEVGQTTDMAGGRLTQTPLVVRIPPGSPPANYLGPGKERMGRITLRTTHPDAPTMELLVRFAVEG